MISWQTFDVLLDFEEMLSVTFQVKSAVLQTDQKFDGRDFS